MPWIATRSWRFCVSLPAAEETYPFGEEVAVIEVGGKMFALVPLSEEPGSVNLKCDPAQALELREAYPGIRPGYDQNKGHWNTVDLDGLVEDDVVRDLIFRVALHLLADSRSCRAVGEGRGAARRRPGGCRRTADPERHARSLIDSEQ